jgi:hypothetical protein
MIRVFFDKDGKVLGTRLPGSLLPDAVPEGTTNAIDVDEETNPAFAIAVQNDIERDDVRLEDGRVKWTPRFRGPGQNSVARQHRDDLVRRLFSDEEELSDTDVRAVLRLIAQRVKLDE